MKLSTLALPVVLATTGSAQYMAGNNANILYSTAVFPVTDMVPKVVDSYTTYCPSPTIFVEGTRTYTVTAATTLTITECPCTRMVPRVTEKTIICTGTCRPLSKPVRSQYPLSRETQFSKPLRSQYPVSRETQFSKPLRSQYPVSRETQFSKPMRSQYPVSRETQFSKPMRSQFPVSRETQFSKPMRSQFPVSVKSEKSRETGVKPIQASTTTTTIQQAGSTGIEQSNTASKVTVGATLGLIAIAAFLI